MHFICLFYNLLHFTYDALDDFCDNVVSMSDVVGGVLDSSVVVGFPDFDSVSVSGLGSCWFWIPFTLC